MGASIAATAYALIAQGLAFAIMPWSIALNWRLRAIFVWAASAVVLFILQIPLMVLILSAIILILAMPSEAKDRAPYFIMVIAAVPTFVIAELPFPGIRYLFEVNHYKICVVLILLPLIFIKRNDSKQNFSFGIADALLVLFVFYLSLRSLLYATAAVSSGVTGALRVLMDHMLMLVAPYFLIRFAIRSFKDAALFLQAILVAAILLASITLISALKQWDFYQFGNSYLFADFRSGYVRINATVNNPSLGMFLIMALLLIEVVRQQINIPWLSLNAMRLVLLLGLPMTDSRAAIGAAIVSVALYLAMLTKSKIARRAALIGLFYAGVVGIFWLALSDFSRIQNDSFTYRQELLNTSLAFIAKYPIFGDYNFYTSGYFDHLVQGQGIIDVTNMYLQVALQHGLLGVALFFLPLLLPTFALARRIFKEERLVAEARKLRNRGRGAASRQRSTESKAEPSDDPPMDGIAGWRRARAAVLASTAGWLFLIATTSDGGLIVFEGIMLAAFSRVLADLKPESAHQPAGEPGRAHDVRSGAFDVDAAAIRRAQRLPVQSKVLPRPSR
jgi:hypothetical protein